MGIPSEGFLTEAQVEAFTSDTRTEAKREKLFAEFFEKVETNFELTEALRVKIGDYLHLGKNLTTNLSPFHKGCTIIPESDFTVTVKIFQDATQRDIISAIKAEWRWIEDILRVGYYYSNAGKRLEFPRIKNRPKRNQHKVLLQLRNLGVLKSDGNINRLKAITHFEGLGEKVDRKLPAFKEYFLKYYGIDISKTPGIRQAIHRIKSGK